MGSTKKSRKPVSLKSGRPPTIKQSSRSISSRATQKTIVTFHQLNRDLEKAKAQKDAPKITSIEFQINALGGLKAYQKASIQGQALDRGGDSSSILMKWLQPTLTQNSNQASLPTLLEIGALSPKNECSRSPFLTTTLIDLHSQTPQILQQNFMHRPLPTSPKEKFNIISLSLVLNFVPTPAERGAMLRRTTAFLHAEEGLLFLVLPASCVGNSRYCNEERLVVIMASLGFVLERQRVTAKLVYQLWRLRDAAGEGQRFGKATVRDGGAMNNFCVVLEAE